MNLRKFIAGLYIFVLFLGGFLAYGQTANSQELTFQKSFQDYEFVKDGYIQKLNDFNKKKATYLKNPTLSLKEELRLSLLDFLNQRNEYIKSYLTVLRTKTIESQGLVQGQKESVYSKIDTEVTWYTNYKNEYLPTDSVEILIEKSKKEDTQWQVSTTPAVNFSLVLISLGEVTFQRTEHEKLYQLLKSEAQSLVSLGRADESLFARWFNDIEKEIANVFSIEEKTKTTTDKLSTETQLHAQRKLFNDSLMILTPAKNSLLKLNNFIYELENVINTRR